MASEFFHEFHDTGKVNTIRAREQKPLSECQLDLADFTKVKHYLGNGKHGWMLVMIDIYSRYLWAVAIKDKTAANVLGGFKVIDVKPENIVTDSGSEYKGVMGQHLRDSGINHFTVEVGDHRSLGIVDRVIRTIRARLRTIWDATETFNWVGHIGEVVKKYNNSVHRTLGDTPHNVYTNMGKNGQPIERDTLINKFPNGTIVRKLLERNMFEKGGSQYSVQRFTVVGRRGFKVELNDGSLFSPRKLIVSKLENDETKQDLRAREQKATKKKKSDQILKRELDIEPDGSPEFPVPAEPAEPAEPEAIAPSALPPAPPRRTGRERQAPRINRDLGYQEGSGAYYGRQYRARVICRF
jgi:hypothetical protein